MLINTFPAISHLVKLGQSPEKLENEFKSFKTTLMELMSSKKNVVSSTYMVYKCSWPKIFKPRIFLFVLIIMEKYFQRKNKKIRWYWIPLTSLFSSLKYLVICPPFIEHDFLFFSNILIQSTKLSPKSFF